VGLLNQGSHFRSRPKQKGERGTASGR